MANNITINGNVTVNGDILGFTLNELIDRLGSVEKKDRTPKWKELAKEQGDPIAETDDIKLYGNGYAVYDNGSAKTVLWVEDCLSYTYHFNTYPCDWLPHKDELGSDYLGEQPWILAVMLRGDHRIEENMANRTGSRKGTKDEEEDKHGDRDEERELKMARKVNGTVYGNPEEILIRREEIRERLSRMTDRQRGVFLAYYLDGKTQQEIADDLGVSKQSVNESLRCAEAKMERF